MCQGQEWIFNIGRGRREQGGALHENVPLSVDPDPEFDKLAKLAASVCGTPFAAVTLFKDGSQWIKGSERIERVIVPAEQSFCIHTLRHGELLEIPNTLCDDRVKDNAFVTGDPHFRFYAGAPLIGSDGKPAGAVCVVDVASRPGGLGVEQRRSLELIASQASLQLRLQQAVIMRERVASDLRSAVAYLHWAANHDVMTGLGNRAMLREALLDVGRAGQSVALLSIDVDHFKGVNDSFGHLAGDELLREIARRLVASVRSNDVVLRLGGDEFAIVVRSCNDSAALDGLAGRLLAAMRTPIVHDGRSIDCRIAIGGAQAPQHTRDPADLVSFADVALGEAKARGRGRYVQFQESFLAERTRRLAQIALAQGALSEGRIVPFYQPKVDLADGRVHGVEALLRIREANGDVRLPEAIAAAFGEADLAQAIGANMLGQILRDMQDWISNGVPFGRVAVNLSATEIGDPTYAGRLLEALAEHDISPDKLEIEVLEDVLLDERSGAVLASIRSLSEAGISIAFDDFGTGYAALAHLPNFPVDVLKIDRSFVRQLDVRANQAIVAAIVSIAGELAIEVVAEGVETVDQAVELLRIGCTCGQGFLYGRAVPAHRLAGILRTRARKRSSTKQSILLADRVRLASLAA